MKRKAVTLLELIVMLAIISLGLVGIMAVVDNYIRIKYQGEIVAQLSLICEREMEALKAQPFEQLQPGERMLKPDRAVETQVKITELEEGALKQLSVSSRSLVLDYPYRVELVCLRSK